MPTIDETTRQLRNTLSAAHTTRRALGDICVDLKHIICMLEELRLPAGTDAPPGAVRVKLQGVEEIGAPVEAEELTLTAKRFREQFEKMKIKR